MTVHVARGRGSPSGRSRTARTWLANCEVIAPSWVQWPELCGRMASSLTRMRPSRRLEELDREMADDAELLRRSAGPAPGPGRASSSSQVRARARSPCRRRRRPAATRRRGRRRPGRAGSGRRSPPARGRSRPSPRRGRGRRPGTGPRRSACGTHEPDALAVVAAAHRLEDDGEAAAPPSANAATSAGSATMRWRGQGTPISSSFARITPLSWACTSASGPGRTGMPSASRARRCSVGTCS